MFESIVLDQKYCNVPDSVKEVITDKVGHRLASQWLDVYRLTKSGKTIFSKSYTYLATIWHCSKRTVMRSIKALEKAGLITKLHKYAKGSQTANTYKLTLPADLSNIIKSKPSRRRPEVQIDYSVDLKERSIIEDRETLTIGPFPGEIKMEEKRPIPPQGDTRDLLKDAPPASGALKGILDRIKNNLSTGGGDKSVTPHSLCLLSNNKTGANAPIAVCRQEEPREQPVTNRHQLDNQLLGNPESLENSRHVDPPCLPNEQNRIHPVPDYAVREVERRIMAMDGISSPQELVKEAIYFVEHRKEGYGIWHAINAFVKLLGSNGQGKWSTPFGMRNKK